jgi:hypothetical protein
VPQQTAPRRAPHRNVGNSFSRFSLLVVTVYKPCTVLETRRVECAACACWACANCMFCTACVWFISNANQQMHRLSDHCTECNVRCVQKVNNRCAERDHFTSRLYDLQFLIISATFHLRTLFKFVCLYDRYKI